jgi:hypothetical protein
MLETQADFSELGPLLALLADRKGSEYTLKPESGGVEGFVISEQQNSKDLKDLDYDVARAQKDHFYKATQFSNSQEEIRSLIKKAYVQLGARHVLTSQELKDCLQLADLGCLDLLLQKVTIFVNDRYYLKTLESPGLTSARNKLLEIMSQSETPLSR